MSAALRALAQLLGRDAFVALARRCADGTFGAWPKAAYWVLVGKKTAIGFALFFVAAALVGLEAGCTEIPVLAGCATYFSMGGPRALAWLVGAAGALVGAGLLDKAWRSDIPAWLAQSMAYRAMVAVAPALSLAMWGAWWALQRSGCSAWWCQGASLALLALGGILGALGIVDRTWRDRGPVTRAGSPLGQ